MKELTPKEFIDQHVDRETITKIKAAKLLQLYVEHVIEARFGEITAVAETEEYKFVFSKLKKQ